MNEVLVTAIVKAKPGRQEVVESLLRNLLVPTHAEPGCLLYALHRSQEDTDTFVFIEKWQSEEHLKKHMYSRHVRQALRAQEAIEEFKMIRLSPIAGGSQAKGCLT